MITILTTTSAQHFDAASEDWARDDSGDVHVFDGQDTLATFNADAFVCTLQNMPADEQRRRARDHTDNL